VQRVQDFGHDLLTGASVTPQEYQAKGPAGRALLKGDLPDGSAIRVDTRDGELVVEHEKAMAS